MKKQYLILFTALVLLTLTILPTQAFAEEPIKVHVDGERISFNSEPIIESGTTLVEFRPIFEKLGLSIGWDGATQTVTGSKQGLDINLTIGSKNAIVNGKFNELQLSPKIVDGRTFIPLRFVGEASGADVVWDGETRTINIVNKLLDSPKLPDLPQFYILTDDKINEAINEGKKGMSNSININSKYKLSPVLNTIDDDIVSKWSDAYLTTPYLSIVRESAMKTREYKNYTLEDGRKWMYSFIVTEALHFEVLSYGDSITSHQKKHVVIVQDGKNIQPTEINGLNEFGEMTNSWPSFPAYMAYLQIEFPLGEIDFSKKAQLIVIHGGDYKTIYDVDFSKYE